MTCVISRLSRDFTRCGGCFVNLLSQRCMVRAISNDTHDNQSNLVHHSVPSLETSPSNSPRNLFSSVCQQTWSHINQFGIQKEDITCHRELSKLPLHEIMLRLQYFVEGGLTPSIELLEKFDIYAKSTLADLKAAGMLSGTVDCIQTMSKCIQFDGPLPNIDEDLSYEQIHFQVLCHCMEHLWGFKYPLWKRYIHMSLQFCFSNFSALSDAQIKLRWIRDHPSIMCLANPYNLAKLCELESFYDVPVSFSQLIRYDSALAFVNFEDIRSIFFLLMKNEVCEHDLLRIDVGNLFLQNPYTLEKSFQDLKAANPSLSCHHLLLYFEENTKPKRKKRLHQGLLSKIVPRQNFPSVPPDENCLEASWQNEMKLWLKSKNTKLKFMPCRHNAFDDSLQESRQTQTFEENGSIHKPTPIIRRRHPDGLAGTIAVELGVSKAVVERELSLIENGLAVDVNVAHDTLMFLFENGFHKSEIRESIQLLLYPRIVVKQTLDKFVTSDPVYGTQAYRHKHLQLCLYHVLIRFSYGL